MKLQQGNQHNQKHRVCLAPAYSTTVVGLATQPKQAKPEVGIQFGAGGTSSVESLAAEGTRDVRQLVDACTTFKEQVSEGEEGVRSGSVGVFLFE